MRLLISLVVLLILVTPCAYAQGNFVTVTGNVLDPGGNVYQNGVYSANFIDPGTSGNLPTLANGQTFQTSLNGSLDSFGFFSIQVADNGVVAAASGEKNTYWSFNFCGNAAILRLTSTSTPLPCFTYTSPIICSTNTPVTCSAGTMSISTQLKAVAAILPIQGVISGLTPGNCVQALTASSVTTTGFPCGSSGGTLTPTGSPLSGYGAFWSGATSLTGNANWLYSPTSGHTLLQGANATDAFYMYRFTDTSPTGNFLHFQNRGQGADLFKVDVLGDVTSAGYGLWQNAGVFTNTQYNYGLQSNLGSFNIGSLVSGLYGGNYFTDALVGACAAPSGATVLQCNGVAGYATTQNGLNAVGVFGLGRTLGSNSVLTKGWGGNTICATTSGAFSFAQECNGFQSDVNLFNTTDFGQAFDCNGSWAVQATNMACFNIVAPSGGFHWTAGLNFGYGATPAPNSGTSAAIVFQPMANSASQISQGMLFVSRNGSNNPQIAETYLDQNGSFDIALPSELFQFELSGLLSVPSLYTVGALTGVGSAILNNPCSLGAGTGTFTGQIWVSVAGCYTTLNAALTALGTSAGTIYIPPGVWTLSSPITMQSSYQHIVGAGIGVTIIQLASSTGYTGSGCTATGQVAVIDIASSSATCNSSSTHITDISITNLTIAGTTTNSSASNVAYGIRTRGVIHSDFSHIGYYNEVIAGYYGFFGVVNQLNDVHVSLNEVGYTFLPQNGIYLDGAASAQTTDNSIFSPILEGLGGTGIFLYNCTGTQIGPGTSEQNSFGINIQASTDQTYIHNMDLESNSTEDIITNGSQLVVVGGESLGTTEVGASSTRATFIGGLYNNFLILSGASNTNLIGIAYNNSGSGTLSDSGVYTTKISVTSTTTNVPDFNQMAATGFSNGPGSVIGTSNVSGCSLTSAVGGQWVGNFKSGTSGTCTVTITMGTTAPHGWQCDAWDATTAADVIKQSNATPSTTTCTISGTTVSGDSIYWKATFF